MCGRAYATPCHHEHACLRCPLQRPDPAQLPRLAEIHTNLHARLAEAHESGWAGEIDRFEVSIAAAAHKLDQMRRVLRERGVAVDFLLANAQHLDEWPFAHQSNSPCPVYSCSSQASTRRCSTR